jgi:hypothetical protein
VFSQAGRTCVGWPGAGCTNPDPPGGQRRASSPRASGDSHPNELRRRRCPCSTIGTLTCSLHDGPVTGGGSPCHGAAAFPWNAGLAVFEAAGTPPQATRSRTTRCTTGTFLTSETPGSAVRYSEVMGCCIFGAGLILGVTRGWLPPTVGSHEHWTPVSQEHSPPWGPPLRDACSACLSSSVSV